MATEGRGRGNGYSCPLRFDFVETQGARRLWGRLARWIQRARRPRSLRAQRGGRQRPPLLPVCGLLNPESSGFLLARNSPTPSLLCCSTMVQSATPQLSDCTTRTEKACDPICRPQPGLPAARRQSPAAAGKRVARTAEGVAPHQSPAVVPQRRTTARRSKGLRSSLTLRLTRERHVLRRTDVTGLKRARGACRLGARWDSCTGRTENACTLFAALP